MPELLDDSNTRHAADLSIRAALAYVAAPEEVKTEVDTKLEAGETVTQKEIGGMLPIWVMSITVSKTARDRINGVARISVFLSKL
jgi:hypothetical protein